MAWVLLGTLTMAATGWAMQIVLAKLGTPVIVGIYALGYAITQPVFAFSNLQLRNIQATDARDEYRFEHYFAARLFTSILAILIIGGIGFIGRSVQTALVITVIAVGVAFDSISDSFYGIMQKRERMDFMGISMAVKGVLNVTMLTTAYCLTHKLIWAMTANSASSLLMLMFYDGPVARRLLASGQSTVGSKAHPQFLPKWNERRSVVKLMWLAMPLGVTLLLLALSNNVSRYFIDHYLGERALGIYSALAALIVIGKTVNGAIGQALTPRLARSFKQGNLPDFLRFLWGFTFLSGLIGVLSVVIAALCGPRLLTFVFTKDYSHDFNVFLVLLAGGGVGYMVSAVGTAMTAAGLYRIQVFWFGFAVAVAALTSCRLVPTRHLMGAAESLLISSVVQLLVGIVIMQRAVIDERRRLRLETVN